MERELEKRSLRVLTFIVTLIGMILGLSLIPIFPQPLPVLISFLVAFAAFMNHGRSGMTMGCLVIGLGLVYHMSRENIISQISPIPEIRILVIVVIPILFFILPFIFYRYEDVIAINLGIISATLLFFGETYYFAIPLILVSATLYKKTKLGLTVSYYVLISFPLQILQFLNYVLSLSNPRWWEDPAADPFIYFPLTGVLQNIQESMIQFRLLQASNVFEIITGQITFSDQNHLLFTTQSVLTRYLDSLPGIILFLVIVVGIVWATTFLTRELIKNINSTNVKAIISAVTSAAGTGLFYFFLLGLQKPLAFRAQVNILQILIGISVISSITFFASLLNYTPKKSKEIEKLSKLILEKAEELLRVRLQVIEWSLKKVRESIPLDVSSIHSRTLIIKTKLEDIISKVKGDFYGISELNEKINEVDNDIRNEIETLTSNLDTSLRQYQLYVYSEYSSWKNKFEGIGLEFKTVLPDFQKELPLEMRIEHIKEALNAGIDLTYEIIPVAEQTYEIITYLYDPNLPEKSLAITFAREKLNHETVSWIALNGIFAALHNWQKQFSTEISKSMEDFQRSLKSISDLKIQTERLEPVLGDNYQRFIELVERANEINSCIEKKPPHLIQIITIKEVLHSSLNIARDLLLIIKKELTDNEKSIENMLLTQDYSWEQKVTWRKEITAEMEPIINPSNYELSQVLKDLHKILSYLDQLVNTILEYNEKKEILLNYPTAEFAIEELFEKKKCVYAQDLPFESKYAEEYLKLFYMKKYDEFSFDQENMCLTRKHENGFDSI